MARPRRSGGTPRKPFQRPDGSVRRSQVVRTNGPGAMIDLVDHAVMVAGLDFWRYEIKDLAGHLISLPRLRDRLAPRFEAAGRELAAEGCFRLPPRGDDKQATTESGIEVLELPRWFVCQNPACRALVRADGLELKGTRYRHGCTRPRAAETVPVRFVATCRRGHVEEFPWVWFAHRNAERICPAPSLKLLEGRPATSPRSWCAAPAAPRSGCRRRSSRARCRSATASGRGWARRGARAARRNTCGCWCAAPATPTSARR